MIEYWLMYSMINEMLKQISEFATFRNAWIKLKKAYASKSRAKVIQIKEELQNLRKTNLNISDYLLKHKLLYDELQSVGYGLFKDEKLMAILVGLDEFYDNIFSIVTMRMISKKN